MSFCSSVNFYLSWFDGLQNTGLDTKVLVPGYESTGPWIQKYWSLDKKVLVSGYESTGPDTDGSDAGRILNISEKNDN